MDDALLIILAGGIGIFGGAIPTLLMLGENNANRRRTTQAALAIVRAHLLDLNTMIKAVADTLVKGGEPIMGPLEISVVEGTISEITERAAELEAALPEGRLTAMVGSVREIWVLLNTIVDARKLGVPVPPVVTGLRDQEERLRGYDDDIAATYARSREGIFGRWWRRSLELLPFSGGG